MERIKWIVILILLMLTGIIALLFTSKSDKKSVSRKPVAKPLVTPEPNNIQSLMEECWQTQINYLNTEMRYIRYREVFCNDSILRYMQRLIGFCHYDIDSYTELEQLKLKAGDQLLGGLYNSINGKMPYRNGRFDVPETGRISATKEAYLLNIGIDIKSNDSKELLIHKLKDDITTRTREIDALAKYENNAFYERLWTNTIASLEALIRFYKEEMHTVKERSVLKNRLLQLVRAAQDNLCRNGVLFPFYEEVSVQEQNNYFVVMTNVEDVPAVIRQKDGYLYHEGKLSEMS